MSSYLKKKQVRSIFYNIKLKYHRSSFSKWFKEKKKEAQYFSVIETMLDNEYGDVLTIDKNGNVGLVIYGSNRVDWKKEFHINKSYKVKSKNKGS